MAATGNESLKIITVLADPAAIRAAIGRNRSRSSSRDTSLSLPAR